MAGEIRGRRVSLPVAREAPTRVGGEMAVFPARSVARWLGGLLVAALVVVAPAGTARAAVTQGIQGTVTGDGHGLSGIGVWVVPVDPDTPVTGDISYVPCDIECDVFEADADGSFDISLPVGEYWLLFAPAVRGDWAPEWWQDSPTREGSAKVTVTADAVTTVDAVLEHGGAVTGTLPGITEAHDVLVEAWLPDATMASGFHRVAIGGADDQGRYRVGGLPTAPGYRLHFLDRTAKREGWWNGQKSVATATPLAVGAPSTVSGIDPELAPWGVVAGRVTQAVDGSGAGLASVTATQGNGWTSLRTATTDASGHYALQLPAGTYALSFTHPDLRTQEVAAQVVTIGEQTTVDRALDPKAMVNLVLPTVRGVPRVDATLSVPQSTWFPSGASLTYQWRSAGIAIPGATGTTYRPRAADVGKLVTVRITASKPGHTSTSAFASATDVVARGVLRLGSTAVVRGTLRVGSRLVAVPPATTPGAYRSYRWLRDGSPVRGATSSSYRLVKADRGRRVAVRITLTRPGYVTRVVTVTRTGLVR